MGTWVPVNVNFTAYQGADFSDCILLKDPDAPTNPLLLPWIHGRLHLKIDSFAAPLLELTDVLDSDGSGLVLTADEGRIEIRIDALTSEAWSLNGEALVLEYDLVCYDDATPNPRVDRVAQGYFIFWPEVSRAAA